VSSAAASSRRAEASSEGNQHPNPLCLQLRVLSSGISCRHRGTYAVTAQQADISSASVRLATTATDTVAPSTIATPLFL
jgi:hypothetical protein